MLAAVTTGIVARLEGAADLDARRCASRATRSGRSLIFLLNALLFVLIGLQLPLILDGLSGQPRGELLWWCVAVSLVVIVTRLVWSQTVVFVVRALDRREAQRERRSTGRTG